MAFIAKQTETHIRGDSDQPLDVVSRSFHISLESLHRGAVAKAHLEDRNHVAVSRPVLQATHLDQAGRHWNIARPQVPYCTWQFLQMTINVPVPSLETHECRLPRNYIDFFFEYQRRGSEQHNLKVAEEISNLIRFHYQDSEQQDTSVYVNSFFNREPSLWDEQVPRPVMAKVALGPPIPSRFVMDEYAFWIDKEQMSPSTANLPGLLLYIRHPCTFELGHWSKGSRDILRKSRYSRPKFLQHVTSLNIVNHTSPKFKEPDGPNVDYALEASRNISDVLEDLTQICPKKHLMSGKWKKFLVALEKELHEESQVEVQQRTDRFRAKVFSYDTPRRNQSSTCNEFIWTRYELSKDRKLNEPSHKLTSESRCGIVSPDRDSDDTLSLSSMSDDPGNDSDVGGRLGALFGSGAEQRRACIDGSSGTVEGMVDLRASTQGGQDHNDVIAARTNTINHVDHQSYEMGLCRNNQTSLRPLDNLVCSPWSLKIAEFCIQKMKKGIVFLPPPLSSFPSLALVVHTFISETMSDSRVVIICEPETEMTSALEGYLNFLFEGRISIETIKRCQCARFPALASLTRTLSRIVILDSFDFTVVSGFSLLLILGPGTTSLSSLVCARSDLKGTVPSSVGTWAVIPSILILPYHACNPVKDFFSEATKLASALGIEEALFIDDVDDVHLSVLLSRPDFIFLVPTREILEIVSTLETYASSYLQVYQMALRETRNAPIRYSNVESLDDVKLDVLEMHLTKECVLVHEQHEAFEVLFALKQARSYALYDGRQTAIEYLSHSARTATRGAMTVLKSLLLEIQGETNSNSLEQHKIHPMTAALKSSLDVMEKQADDEAPSLRSIHRREKFKPLIIANSKEACDGLMRAIPGASDVLEAKEGLVAVCENHHVYSAERTDRRLSAYEKAVQEELTKFSHVIHVLGDRTRAISCELLPPKLLESIHAGKIRLITIAVDESRALEHLWLQNELLYSTMCKIVREATSQRITKCKESYMLHVPLSWFTSHNFSTLVHGKIIRPLEPVNVCKSSIQTCRQDRRVYLDRHPSLLSTTQTESAEFKLTPSAICALPIASLRSRLKGALRKMQDELSSKQRLRVVVQVSKDQKYTPAATYLFTALVSDEYLHRHVEVVFR